MADVLPIDPTEGTRQSSTAELLSIVRKLANAEAELRSTISGQVDAFVHPDGYLFLLGDAQRALLENEHRYRTLFEASPDALATFSAESDLFIQVNERTKQLFGVRAELLLLGPLHVSPELQPDGRRSRDAHSANVARALAGEHLLYEWEFRAADGRPIPCEVRLVRLPAAEVHAACLLTIVDLTERKRVAAEVAATERKARDSASLVQALVESVTDLIWQVDLDGRVSFANRVPQGLHSTDVVGAQWLALASPDHRTQLAHVFSEVKLSAKPLECEFEGVGEKGERPWYSARLSPVRRDEGTVAVVLIARDITEKRRTEAQLIASDRMASVGTLAAGVAHEINNPLCVVLANLELVNERLGEPALADALPQDVVEEIRDARAAAERVRHIVKDIKVFSRSSEETIEPVDVQRVLDSTLRLALNEVRHRARLVKDYAQIPTALANESRLGQVFLNLVVNAAQAIEDGNAAANEVRVKTRVDSEGSIVVSISDTGQGISPEVQKRLFTPFVTTKPVGVGTGLGLSICQRIVTSFGGRIEFSSELGKGTEFRVVLPASTHPETVRPRPPSVPVHAVRRGHLLIIDDDLAVAQALCRTLEAEHEVSVVTNARTALTRLKANKYDLVVCDLMMPEMAGIEVRREFRRVHPERVKRWLFMTGGAFTPEAREVLDAESYYIEKPFDVQDVRAMINGLLA